MSIITLIPIPDRVTLVSISLKVLVSVSFHMFICLLHIPEPTSLCLLRDASTRRRVYVSHILVPAPWEQSSTLLRDRPRGLCPSSAVLHIHH